MIEMEEMSGGVAIHVKVLPGSRKNEVRGEQDGMLKISVTQAPEKGKATQAAQEQLAKSLRLRKSQLQLLAGETNRRKKFLIADITVEELCERLTPLLGS